MNKKLIITGLIISTAIGGALMFGLGVDSQIVTNPSTSEIRRENLESYRELQEAPEFTFTTERNRLVELKAYLIAEALAGRKPVINAASTTEAEIATTLGKILEDEGVDVLGIIKKGETINSYREMRIRLRERGLTVRSLQTR